MCPIEISVVSLITLFTVILSEFEFLFYSNFNSASDLFSWLSTRLVGTAAFHICWLLLDSITQSLKNGLQSLVVIADVCIKTLCLH